MVSMGRVFCIDMFIRFMSGIGVVFVLFLLLFIVMKLGILFGCVVNVLNIFFNMIWDLVIVFMLIGRLLILCRCVMKFNSVLNVLILWWWLGDRLVCFFGMFWIFVIFELILVVGRILFLSGFVFCVSFSLIIFICGVVVIFFKWLLDRFFLVLCILYFVVLIW